MKKILQITTMAICLMAADMDTTQALDKESIIRLLREGVSEDTIILIVRRENRQYNLTVDDVGDLKHAGASDALLNAMLGQNAARRASTASNVVVIHSSAVPNDHGILLVRNESAWDLTIAWNRDRKNIYVHRGVSAQPSVTLACGQTYQIVMHTGTWDVSWLGQDEALEVKIKEGRTSVLTLRAEIDGSIVGVYSSDGVIRASGVLWTAVDRERERRLERELERAREAAEDLAREAERLRSERGTAIIIERQTRHCPPPPVVIASPSHPVIVKPFPSHPPVVIAPPPPAPPVVVKPFPSHPPVVVYPTQPPRCYDGWSIWYRSSRSSGWWNW